MTPRAVPFEAFAAALDPWPGTLPAPPRALAPTLLAGTGGLPGLVDAQPGAPRTGAVLALIYPGQDGAATLVLTERPRGSLRHSGEVSLPGGAVEQTDASIEEAALREASEEVGLDRGDTALRILGRLHPVHVRVSGFVLEPVVAVTDHEPVLRPDPREVAAIIAAPLGHFVPGAPIEVAEETLGGRRLRYGYFPVAGYRVWGATARILGQLGALVDPALLG